MGGALLTQEAKVLGPLGLPLLILMKRSCSNILNAAVGSMKQIPLLSINAAAMREGGEERGGGEGRGGALPIHRLINLPLLEQMHCKEGLGCCCNNSRGREGTGGRAGLLGRRRALNSP